MSRHSSGRSGYSARPHEVDHPGAIAFAHQTSDTNSMVPDVVNLARAYLALRAIVEEMTNEQETNGDAHS